MVSLKKSLKNLKIMRIMETVHMKIQYTYNEVDLTYTESSHHVTMGFVNLQQFLFSKTTSHMLCTPDKTDNSAYECNYVLFFYITYSLASCINRSDYLNTTSCCSDKIHKFLESAYQLASTCITTRDHLPSKFIYV